MGWKANLTDGKVFTDDKSPGCWRIMKEYCDKNSVKIKTLYWKDEEVDPKADFYFTMHEIKSYVKTGYTTLKKGIGSIRNGKMYIDWYVIPSEEKQNREVQQIKDFIWEIAIQKEKA